MSALPICSSLIHSLSFGFIVCNLSNDKRRLQQINNSQNKYAIPPTGNDDDNNDDDGSMLKNTIIHCIHNAYTLLKLANSNCLLSSYSRFFVSQCRNWSLSVLSIAYLKSASIRQTSRGFIWWTTNARFNWMRVLSMYILENGRLFAVKLSDKHLGWIGRLGHVFDVRNISGIFSRQHPIYVIYKACMRTFWIEWQLNDVGAALARASFQQNIDAFCPLRRETVRSSSRKRTEDTRHNVNITEFMMVWKGELTIITYIFRCKAISADTMCNHCDEWAKQQHQTQPNERQVEHGT